MTLHTRQSRFLHYNAGAFVSQGEACLVDPGILDGEIAALVEELGDANVRSIVLTHNDWDHILGPEHLPPATIVAHAAYGHDLDVEGIRAQLGRLEQHAGVTRERPFEPPLPATTFTNELTLPVGDLELQLEHAPGHSENMLTIYEPGSGALWAADVLSDIEIPSVIDDLDGYEQTLARLAQLEIRTLVPGHGTPTEEPAEIQHRIDEDRAYLAELRATITEAIAAGRSLEETATACGGITLRRSEGDDEIHRLNVEKIYADLGGEADPEQVGYARAWKNMSRE